jgi:RNA polymerase sigma factor (sigma-70 family)
MQDPEGDALTSLHVRRAVAGTPASLEWVVERLSPLLLAHASYRLGPALRASVDPQDLVNETWLVALPRLGDLEPQQGRVTPVLLKFLTSTLLFQISNLVRKHVRRQRLGAAAPDLPTAPTPSELPAETCGVVTRAVQRELHGQVLACLEELSPQDREVILLRGVEQQDNQTVATLLGLEPPAVSMRYTRALRRLREKLPASIFDELPAE